MADRRGGTPLRRGPVGSGRTRRACLSELQRLLHPRPQTGGAHRRSGSACFADAGRRPHQPVRADPGRPHLPGQGTVVHRRRTAGRRARRRTVPRRPVCHRVPVTARLPPRAYALARHPARNRARARPPFQRRHRRGRQRAGPVRAQRAPGLPLRYRLRPDGLGDGRRAAGLRRGNGLERRGDSRLRGSHHPKDIAARASPWIASRKWPASTTARR